MSARDSAVNPWVGLRPFRTGERELFFGRARETEILFNLVATLQTLVVYAPSGTGKSSLINAGLAARIAEDDTHMLIFADDPRLPVADQVRARLATQGWTAPPDGDLADVLEQHWAETDRRVVIVVDQFEERLNAGVSDDELFVAAAKMVHRSTDAGCIALSIREDYLGSLEPLMRRVPGLLNGSYRVPPLTRQALEEAIYGPLRTVGGGVKPEPKLVTRVLDDLGERSMRHQEPGEQRFEPGYFQIVWSRLWQATVASGSPALTLRQYRGLGGATAILKDFTSGILDELEPAQAQVFWAICRYLVLPTGAKTALTIDDLTRLLRPSDYLTLTAWRSNVSYFDEGGRSWLESLNVDETTSIIRAVFEHLTMSRAPVFQRVIRSDREEFELLHDLLGKILLDWRDEYAQRLGDDAEGCLRDIRRDARVVVSRFLAQLSRRERAHFATPLWMRDSEEEEESGLFPLGDAPPVPFRDVPPIWRQVRAQLDVVADAIRSGDEGQLLRAGWNAVVLATALYALHEQGAASRVGQQLFSIALSHPSARVRRRYQELAPFINHRGISPSLRLPTPRQLLVGRLAVAIGVALVSFVLAYVFWTPVAGVAGVGYPLLTLAHAVTVFALLIGGLIWDRPRVDKATILRAVAPGWASGRESGTASQFTITRQKRNLHRVRVTPFVWPIPAFIIVGLAYGAAALAQTLGWSATAAFTITALYSSLIMLAGIVEATTID